MGKREAGIRNLMAKHNLTWGQAEDLLDQKTAFEEKRDAKKARDEDVDG